MSGPEAVSRRHTPASPLCGATSWSDTDPWPSRAAAQDRRGLRRTWERDRAPDEAPLRRISWRLAALTVGLLCALLLVLGVTLYATMQAAVQDTMQQTLRARIAENDAFARDRLMPRSYGPEAHGPGPGVHGPGQGGYGPPPAGPPPGTAPNTSGTFCVVADASLRSVTQADGSPFGRALRPIRVALRHQRDFVADAAHELRTPVTILRNAAELGLVSLADLNLPPDLVADQQAAYAQTLAQTNHLGRLVDDLALLARADSGAVTLERARVDLAHLVAEATAGMEMLAEDRGARLDVVLPPPLCVVGDAGRLRQVLPEARPMHRWGYGASAAAGLLPTSYQPLSMLFSPAGCALSCHP